MYENRIQDSSQIYEVRALWKQVIISIDLIHRVITKIPDTAIAIYKQISVVIFYHDIPSWRSKPRNTYAWLYSQMLMLSDS